jgi:plasmid stabilization system protein ParE
VPPPFLTQRARVDLRRIRRWVAKDSGAKRADELVDRILAVCGVYATQPSAGPSHPDLGAAIRSCMTGSYLIFYRPRGATIEIIRVIDGRRDLPAAWAELDPANRPP